MEFGGRERGGGRVFEGKVGLEERPRIVDGPGVGSFAVQAHLHE